MRVVLAALLLILCARQVEAQEVLDQILSKLDIHPIVAGQFQQHRDVDFLERPLASSGNFRVDRVEGLEWRVLSPVKSTMQILRGTLTLNGKTVSDMGAGRLMAVVMQGAFNGDFSELKNHFHLIGKIRGENWTLELVPKSNLLKKGIEVIQLKGGNYLSEISLQETFGARTTIRLYNLKMPSEQLG